MIKTLLIALAALFIGWFAKPVALNLLRRFWEGEPVRVAGWEMKQMIPEKEWNAREET